jgi:hypothetical protein
MKHPLCPFCQKPKATLACGLCASAVCKYCAQFIEENRMIYKASVPPELSHTTYCGPCFDFKVAPELEAYDAMTARAKNITVFFKAESKDTRLVERKEKPLKVKDCPDREETLMRLAFMAAEAKFNSIIDVELSSVKVRNHAYQTSVWEGRCIPVQLSQAKIDAKRFS